MGEGDNSVCHLVDTESSLSLIQHFNIAQCEIGNLIARNETCDMNFIFDSVVNYLFVIESCQLQHPSAQYLSYTDAAKCYNKPAQSQNLLDYNQSQIKARLDHQHGAYLPTTFKLQSVEKPSKDSSDTSLQKVHDRLVAVEKERDNMLEGAKKEAFKKEKTTIKYNWYDFSGCPKKYN